MGSEISESGWTMYIDQSVDSWSDIKGSQFDIEQQQKKSSRHISEVAEKCPAYDYEASNITGNEEDSSITSDASSGPQKLPLPRPVQDIEFEKGNLTGPYCLVTKRKRGVDDNPEESKCMASSSSVGVTLTRRKFRKVNEDEGEHEHALFFQDTASSAIHSP